MAGRTTFQLPLASAVASTDAPSSFTVTASPGSAEPQIGRGRSRCKTMWLSITFGSVTSALARGDAVTTSRREAMTSNRDADFFMKDLGGWLDSVLIRTAAAIRLTARQAGSQFIGTAALFSIQNAAASTMSDFDRRHPKFQ